MAFVPPAGLPLAVPQDVLDLLTRIFSDCNDRVTSAISRIPTLHEDALDQQLIAFLTQLAPVSVPTSGWTIDLETHFLGGGHHYLDRWEIGDIGVIVALRRGDKAIWSKAAVLQSKKLFPHSLKHNASEDRRRFVWGFGQLHGGYKSLHGKKTFKFTSRSRYKSLDLRAEQAERLLAYQGSFKFPFIICSITLLSFLGNGLFR